MLKGPITLLVEAIDGDHWALMQLLLSLSKKETYRRILCCPTYPVRTKTKDLETRLHLLNDSISSDSHGISHVLALLYESTIELKYRKKYGQYFTPPKIAEEAVALLTPKRKDVIIDPGCGTGCFALEILRGLAKKSSDPIDLKYLGVEKDSVLALSSAISLEWANAPSHWKVLYADFLSLKSETLEEIGFKGPTAIIANPPFVRYHKLGERSDLANEFDISLYSGLHSYFLAHSARLLLKGRMVFILPLEMNETRYGSDLMKKLHHRFSVERRCVYYDKQIDTWGLTEEQEPEIDDQNKNFLATIVLLRDLTYEANNGLSSVQNPPNEEKTPTLNVIASVHRGISSGANDYFVLTSDSAEKMMIPEEYLTKVIPPKTPSIMLKEEFALQDWEKLKSMGRPCLLLTIGPKEPPEKLPTVITKYIKMGERRGIHQIPTCRNRKPWWYSVRIPKTAPDYMFTYMFRHTPRFFFNKAHVYHLTNLLGVYFKRSSPSVRKIANVGDLLNTELAHWFDQGLIGRKYAGGLVKLEPHDLEKMPISRNILKEFGVSTLD